MTAQHRQWRLRFGTLLGLALVSLALVDGCGGHAPAPAVPSPQLAQGPAWLGQPVGAAVQPAPQSPPPVDALAAHAAASGRSQFDPSAIRRVLDDPRLKKVAERVRREAFRGAANELARLIVAVRGGESEPAWSYQLGRLRQQAGQPKLAVQAFDRAAAVDWPLADYARLDAGRILAQLGQSKEALVRLGQVAQGGAFDDEVALASARAHVAARDVDAAAPIWRAYLARKPRASEWQLVALRFAQALLYQPSIGHAEEAVRVARDVIYNSPRGRGVGEARDLESKALATIPSKRRGVFIKPELEELVQRARSLADARQPREAMAASKRLLKVLGDKADDKHEAACEAHLARGKGLALLKRYSESSDVYDRAISSCQGHPRQVYAFFLGARSALRGGRKALARRRYRELERVFPRHRFADDARLHGAEAARDLGDVAAFTMLLQTMAEDYPTGDMVDQGLFSLARASFERGDWAGAVTPLETAIKRQTRGRPYYAEGRPQYYLARAKLELGASEEGKRLLAGVIRDFPLSYYMVQAHARLSALDPARARSWLHGVMAEEPRGDFVIPDHSELHRPAFLRAVELVRQDDGRRAFAELESLGVRSRKADPSLRWAAAFLLARIDAPAESHGVLRASRGPWSEHYPVGIWRGLWQVAYPRPFEKVVKKQAGRFGVPEHLAYAIIREESAFKPRAVSHAGAYGLMQLIVPTAERMAAPLGLPATIASLKTPEVNIPLGCRFLSLLQRRFRYNPLLAIPGYNAGPGAPARWVKKRPAESFDLWIERIPYRETRRYTKRVIRTMAAYSMLYGEGMGGALLTLPLQVKPAEAAGG